jgi:glycosyltransferase involved in cell wall biosynthesis
MVKKVLVINKYHFVSGGAERYFLSVLESLRSRGIEAIPLSIDYAKTLASPYQKYFIEPIVQNGQAKIINQNPSLQEKLKLMRQAVYNQKAADAVRKIYADFRPDVAYLLNINNHISPSVIDACSEMGIPSIMRMSDFNLVCASSMYFRNGNPCTDCKGGLHHALKHKCVHDSFTKTLAGIVANSYHRWLGTYRKVSAFVAPTEFMRRDLIELGLPAGIIHRIDTFVRPIGRTSPDTQNPYITFIGRFADYKGADLAVQAFSKMKNPRRVRLRVIGDEGDEDATRVRSIVEKTNCPHISVEPFERDEKKVIEAMKRSLFSLVPSRFYENLPNTMLETFSCGRPVIATRLGSIPDIIQEGVNGLLFEYGNLSDFSQKIEWLIEHDSEREQMGENAYQAVLTKYSEEDHMQKLLRLFEEVVGGSLVRTSQETVLS